MILAAYIAIQSLHILTLTCLRVHSRGDVTNLIDHAVDQSREVFFATPTPQNVLVSSQLVEIQLDMKVQQVGQSQQNDCCKNSCGYENCYKSCSAEQIACNQKKLQDYLLLPFFGGRKSLSPFTLLISEF